MFAGFYRSYQTRHQCSQGHSERSILCDILRARFQLHHQEFNTEVEVAEVRLDIANAHETAFGEKGREKSDSYI